MEVQPSAPCFRRTSAYKDLAIPPSPPHHLTAQARSRVWPRHAVKHDLEQKQRRSSPVQGHRPSQNSSLPPSSASLTLLNVLHEVPSLLERLTTDAQKALSAVSRSFRERFVAQVQVVTVTCSEDYALVLKHRWPLLSMVIVLQPKCNCCFFPPPPSGRMLAWISINSLDNTTDALIVMFSPIGRPTASDVIGAPLAAQQVACHMTAKWPGLIAFKLSDVKLNALGCAIIAQLTKGDWSTLVCLELPKCGLSAQAVSLLPQGNWPALKVLCLSQNLLDAEAMTLLTTGNWPCLQALDVSMNPTLDAPAISHLSTSNWPLSKLDLSCVPVSAAMAAELAKLQLPNLSSIDLYQTGLTAAAMSELAKAHWPCLEYLSLCYNDLGAAAVQDLCMMCLPALEVLHLSYTNMRSEGAYWLARGSWPLLRGLTLSDNRLDEGAIHCILNGAWPQLQELLLAGNPFGYGTVLHSMVKWNWPSLKYVQVGLDMLTGPDSASVLGLNVNKLREPKDNVDGVGQCSVRTVSQPDLDWWLQSSISACYGSK